MMEKDDLMKEALAKRRKMKGVDISIMIGPSEAQAGDQDEKTDLAPKGEMDEKETGMDELDEAQDKAMMEEQLMGLSDKDKLDMEQRKPRSLGDRVKMLAMEKQLKK